MATLKLCLMVHVETGTAYSLSRAADIGRLASAVGYDANHGAKLSVQFGRDFLDKNTGIYDPGMPSALAEVLSFGGNFWPHTHDQDAPTLKSTYACVMSAYVNENAVNNRDIGTPLGRSGGCASDGSADWVSITQGVRLSGGQRLRFMNSAVMGAHGNVPITLRPYGFTADEIDKLYPKGQAPGPIDSDVATMRNRPFYVQYSNDWFTMVNTNRQNATYASLGSIVMIPAPGKLDLPGLDEERSAYRTLRLTTDDMKAAVTQAYTSYQMMATHQNSICNAWYTHIPFSEIEGNPNNICSDLRDMVQTINAVLPAPNAEWKNMNEIASIFTSDLGI